MDKQQKRNINAAKKQEYARHIILELEASKKAKVAEEFHQLQRKSKKMDSLLKMKESQMELTSSRLQEITDKLAKASSALAYYNKQLKSKKVLIQCYNNKEKDLSTETYALKFQWYVKLLKGRFHC